MQEDPKKLNFFFAVRNSAPKQSKMIASQMSAKKIEKIIRKTVLKIIRADLTTNRHNIYNEKLEPYTESMLAEFMKINKDHIENIIKTICSDFQNAIENPEGPDNDVFTEHDFDDEEETELLISVDYLYDDSQNELTTALEEAHGG